MITYDNLRDKGFPPSECDYICSKVKEAYEQGVKFAFYDKNSYEKGVDDCIEIILNADVDISPSRDIILRDFEKLKEIKND